MLDKETVNEAIKGLYTFLERKAEQKQGKGAAGGKKALFDDGEDVLLTLALKKVPSEQRTKPIRVPIPHSLYHCEGQSVCVFTKDPQAEFEELLMETHKVENVKEVIAITKLRKDFHEYKDRRTLLATHNLFLADDRIVPLLPNLLGNKFFHKKKQPVPVNLRAKNLKAEIERARDATYMFISTGATVCVRVGRSDMPRKHVVENIMAAIEGMVAKIPKKWNNIQQVFVKSNESVALPLFSALPDVDVVASRKKRKQATPEAQEDKAEDKAAEVAQQEAAEAEQAAKKAKKAAKKALAEAAAAAAAAAEATPAKDSKKKRKAAKSPAPEAATPGKKRTKKRAVA